MKKYIFGVVAVVLLAAAYYGISPLFRNKELNEELPIKVAPVPTSSSTQAGANSPTTSINEAMPADIKKDTLNTPPATVTPTPTHPASGTVRIVSDGTKSFVRYENFKTINGPDIFVYLSKDLDAKDYVSIGRVKATEGNINYEIPSGVNPRDYPYILVWCETFGVLFNSAKVY